MRYMLLAYSPEGSWTPDEWKKCVEESLSICEELEARGALLAASPLHPVLTGTTVRVREGAPWITSGPFAETVEQLGGFFLIDVEHLDEAIAIAARLPSAKKGAIEIRPLLRIDGLPEEKLRLPLDPNRTLQKYMFLCYDIESVWEKAGPEAHHAAIQEAVRITQQLDAQGQYLSASPLHSSAAATSVRLRDGKRWITDGPFAETNEVLGGYYLILAADQDEAVRIATNHPGARVGSVEVRQVFEVSP